MKKRISYLALYCTMLLGSCYAYRNIEITQDPSADWNKQRTYAWLPDLTDTSTLPYNSLIIRNNIRNYFSKAFAERGFVMEKDTPVYLLQIVIDHKKQEQELRHYIHPAPFYFHRYYMGSDYYFPFPPDYYYSGSNLYCYPFGYCVERVQVVHGAISLNVIDRRINKLIWTGKAEGDLYDPQFINRSIHPAVEGIMRKFPIPAICCTDKGCKKEPDDVYIQTHPAIQ